LSFSVEVLEPTDEPFRVHAHDDGVKLEQFAVSDTAPPELVEGLWPIPMEHVGVPPPPPLLMTQVTSVPETETLEQPLKLKVTSARARGE
jgi:hypothetical protein